MATNKHERIRRRAHEIWEREGRPEGAAVRHWQQACDELGGDSDQEAPQNLSDEIDRDDAALLQGAGESGEIDRLRRNSPGANKKSKSAPSSKSSAANVKTTHSEKPSRQRLKKTGVR